LFRTGFEEDKNFHVVLNSVIAGRYHVTEYLGSAAFSKAIQAHDLHTGVDVCIKIIKNNKDFFDQSLDEIKLLKYVNKHDPGDKYHILRLYDYFYYRVSDSGFAADLVNTIAFYFQSIVVQHLILSFLENFNINFITIWMTK
jgi:serine/threonine protein kinase